MERRAFGAPRRRDVLASLALFALGAACSFNYGDAAEVDASRRPDVVMSGVEYVRVRDGVPQVRVQADTAERYESTNTMRMEALRFEQYDPTGEKADAVGSAGNATVNLSSGDASLGGDVRIYVPSEDLSIETRSLEWNNENRTVASGAKDMVEIRKADGSSVTGKGFSADVRSRTWNFSGGGAGLYVDEGSRATSSGTGSAEEKPVDAVQGTGTPGPTGGARP